MAEGFNEPIAQSDPTAHAEIVACGAAGAQLRNYRLAGTTLRDDFEPCLMRAWARWSHAAIGRLVDGTPEPKAGAIESATRALDTPRSYHRFDVTGGVLADESRELMQAFFASRRTP